MKKIIFLCVMVAMVFSPVALVKAEVAAAPTGATQEQIQALYQSLMQQLVALLMEQLADLRAQLAEVQREAKGTSVVQPVILTQSMVPVVTQPVIPVDPIVAATTTIAAVSQPSAVQENFYPQITIVDASTTVQVGVEAFVEWSATSLRQGTSCKVNNEERVQNNTADSVLRGVYRMMPQASGSYDITISCTSIGGNYAGGKKVIITAY